MKLSSQAGILRITWSLLTKVERRRLPFLGFWLLAGTVVELLSLGALVPLLQGLTRSNLRSDYPVINSAFPNSSDNFIVVAMLVGVMMIFLLKELILGFSLWFQRGFISRLEIRFQTELFDRYTCQSYEFHLTRNTSSLSRNILSSTNFTNNILDPVFILLTEGFVIVALGTALIVIEPIAMLATIFSIGTFAVLFHVLSKRRIEHWGLERQLKDGLKLQHMNETFGGMKEVLTYGKGQFFRTRFAINVGQLSQINRKFVMILGIPRLYLELLAVVGLSVLVITMLALGRSSESLVILLVLFAGSAFRLVPAINRITFAFQSLRMGRPTADLLVEAILGLEDNNLATNNGVKVQFESTIRFEDVSYSYPDTERKVLSGFSIEIDKGSEVGIIGPTGSGKSTLVDILLGLLRPTHGRVTVDGIDISTNIRSWQELIGYVPQSIFLMDSSIRTNVAFGIPENEIDEKKVLRALNLAQLTEFVDELPNGMDEYVGERGVRLSGGQRQRIGIARALYLDPPILVFDEATSALDVDTEREVMKSLEYLRTDRTILIVTHRLSALEHCDQRITIENGAILNS